MCTGLNHASVILACCLPISTNNIRWLLHWFFWTSLTLMPSNRDRALRGRRARSVLRDLMAVSSE